MTLILIILMVLLLLNSQCEVIPNRLHPQNVSSESENGTKGEVSGCLVDKGQVHKDETLRMKQKEGRIEGGTPLQAGDMPSYVIIFILSQQVCGGNIITDRHVLTAAHCVTIMNKREDGLLYFIVKPEVLEVRIGSTVVDEEGFKNFASDVRVHPDYLTRDSVNEYRDVAIIILWYVVEFNFFIKPATLHSELNETEVEEMAGKKCVVAGWGETETGSTSKQIMKTEVTLVAYNICEIHYTHHVDPRAHICAYDIGRGACKGDSGGGLFCDGQIIALVSWSIGCASGNPGVYARVDNAQDFINTATQKTLTYSSTTTAVFIILCVNYFS